MLKTFPSSSGTILKLDELGRGESSIASYFLILDGGRYIENKAYYSYLNS